MELLQCSYQEKKLFTNMEKKKTKRSLYMESDLWEHDEIFL
jgi:hypothetical protein